MRSQIKIFSQYVKDYMAPPLVVLQADAKVSDLVDRMAHSAASSALIVTHDHRLNGIVTGSDVIKRVALRCEADTPVTAVMSSPVRSVRGSDHLFHALRRMHQYNLDKLPVVDSARRPIGIIRLSDVLSATVEPILSYGSTDGDEEGTGGLKRIKESQVDLADQLLRDGMPATEVQLLLSQINRYIHKEVLETSLAKMEDGGWGHPPVPFAAIIMGSGGRSESFLNPDQDNGFILGDYADDRHGRIDPYFIELAEQVTLDLDEIGFPLCDGYIMATNAGWRKTLPQWQEQLAYWRRNPSLIIIRQADIFFDFQAFYGEDTLSRDLRRYVANFGKASPAFLKEMHVEESSQLGVALDLFGRLRDEKHDPEHEGELNLKYSGTIPLTQSVRLLALREGIEETSTLARLDHLNSLGSVDKSEMQRLRDAYSRIAALLLRQQIRDIRDERKPSYYIPIKSLSQWERQTLAESLKSIAEFRKRVDEELTGVV